MLAVRQLTPIPEGPIAPLVDIRRPFSITSALSNENKRLVNARLSRFLELNFVLPFQHNAFCKGLGTCDVLLSVSHVLQAALERGRETKLAPIDYSAAFDRVNHLEHLLQLRVA